MGRTLAILLTIAILTTFCSARPTAAASTLWQTFVESGRKAYSQGQYMEAQHMYEAALKEVDSPGGKDIDLADNLVWVANCYCAQARYIEAEPLFKRALDIYEQSQSPDQKGLASCLNDFAALYEAQSKAGQARPLFERARSILEKITDPQSASDIAGIDNNLGNLAVAEGRLSEAESLYTRAIREFEALPGHSADTDLAMAFNNLGLLYSRQGKYMEAEPLLKHAIEMRERSLNSNHPDLAGSLNNLGLLYKLQGKLSDAEPFFSRALAIWEKALGREHPDAILASNNLSECRTAAGAGPNISGAAGPTADGSSKVRRGAAVTRPVRDKWAVVIGIGRFADQKINLKYASKDAVDFGTFLVKQAHFAPDHVLMLIDEKATRQNILAALGDKWLPKVAGPNDLVLIYISSHGTASKLDLEGINYIVAHDTTPDSLYATGIPLQDLNRIIKDRVHCDRVVLILDACHSGAATGGNKGLVRASNINAEEVMQGTGQLVICSSKPDQVSWESKQYPNGVFTHRLIEALSLKGPQTELGDAYDRLRENVQQEVLHDRGELQTPVLMSLWEGQNLLLAAPPANPGPAPVGLMIAPPVRPAVP